MNINPCSTNLLIEMRDVQTDSKVLLPDSAKRFPHGEVVAVGPDVTKFAVGDLVLFLPDNLLGFDHPIHGQQFILAEGSVLATYA